MITEPRIVTYLNSLEHGNGELLDRIEAEAIDTNVPIIKKELQSFLKVMLQIIKPERILELGTAVGYSAILMSGCIEKGSRIITIENYEKRIPIAKENIKKAGKEEVITLLEGDALEILPELNEKFDFIFMDAAKGQYMNFLHYVLPLMNEGAVLISDNVLQEGSIVESKYAMARRERTIHKRMRDYLYTLKNHEMLETSIVPIGDGIAISLKKPEKGK